MLGAYVRRGAYNTLMYSFSSVIIRLISFLFLPFFLSQLSLTEFGVWDFYQSFFSLGTLLLSSCAAVAITRFYLLYKDNPIKQQQAIGNGCLFVLISTLIFVPNAWFLVTQTKHLSSYAGITLCNVAAFALFSIVLAFLRVKEYLWWYVSVYCGQNIIAVLLTVLGVYYGFGINAFFYANLISFCLFVPLFFMLLLENMAFSWSLFKEQLSYSFPLFVCSILYLGLSSIDRFFIKTYAGYETLGTYALLWRFGALFQFGSIALMDAWPIILFNAQREDNAPHLISRLITYLAITLLTGCLIVIVAARCAIGIYFPVKYYYLILYLPFFFVPIGILEIARLFQAGFGLSTKTIYMPFLSAIILCIQASLLFYISTFGLHGIFMANSTAFCIYALLSYWASQYAYPEKILDIPRIIKLSILFFIYILALQFLFMLHTPWYWAGILLLSWPFTLLSTNILSATEKDFLRKKILLFFCKKNSIKKNLASFDRILYLRTDICFHEITAGGSVAHTLGVINGFKKIGTTVLCASVAMPTLLAQLNLPYFKQLTVPPLFCMLRWKFANLRWRLECLFSNIFFAWQIRHLLRTHAIDIIYHRHSLLNCLGVIICYFRKIPLILEYNGSEVWIFSSWSEKKWFNLSRLAQYLEYVNLHYADYIIVVSEVLKDDLIKRGVNPRKILVNPNGVDPEQFNPDALSQERNMIRSLYNIENKFVFGFVGTFSYWHGIEVLEQIIPKIIQEKLTAHFMLIGDGPLKQKLQKTLIQHNVGENQVTFTGLVPQHEAKKYLAACDAFLSPTQPNADGTRFFGSPTKIFEYLSMGKPIIASDLEQLSELIYPALTEIKHSIINNEVGILVPPTDIDGFIHAALYVLTLQKSDVQNMGDNARNKALKHHSWNQHVQNIQQFVTQTKR